jgi:hypothetical protein
VELLERILIWFVAVLSIGWLAVFICAFASHRRGTMPRFYSGGRSGHGLVKLPPLVWWKKVLMIPVACILIPIFAACWLIVMPPMFIIERWIFRV